MTREQRWLRREMKPLLEAIQNERRWPATEHDKRHYRARLETLRRILAIVEKAQG